MVRTGAAAGTALPTVRQATVGGHWALAPLPDPPPPPWAGGAIVRRCDAPTWMPPTRPPGPPPLGPAIAGATSRATVAPAARSAIEMAGESFVSIFRPLSLRRS